MLSLGAQSGLGKELLRGNGACSCDHEDGLLAAELEFKSHAVAPNLLLAVSGKRGFPKPETL